MRERPLNNNKEVIKVRFDELLYDFIFIIVISKLSQMFAHMLGQMTFSFIFMEISIFIMIFWMWMRKVMLTNNLHVLSKKLNVNFLRYNIVTYVEITALILLFYQMDTYINSYFYLIIVLGVIVFGMVYMNLARHVMLKEYGYSPRMLSAMFVFRKVLRTEINLEYLLERFGVLLLLFLGEILSVTFNIASNWMTLLLGVIIVIGTFNTNLKVIEYQSEMEEVNAKKFRLKIMSITNYFRIMFIFLLLIILELETVASESKKHLIILIATIIAIKIYQRWYLRRVRKKDFTLLQVGYLIYFALVLVVVFYFQIYNIFTLLSILGLVIAGMKIDSSIETKH